MKQKMATTMFITSAFVLLGIAGLKAECDIQPTLLNLQTIRSALTIYYGDTEGKYPKRLKDLVPRYLVEVPVAHIGDDEGKLHPDSNQENYFSSVKPNDEGAWGYVNDPSSQQWGEVFVNCYHASPEGRLWYKY